MHKKQLTLIFFFLLITFSNFISINAIDRNLVGVEVGDSFNLKIVANSFNPASLGIDFDSLDIDLEELSLDTIGFSIEDLIPSLNDVIGVEVTTLPDNVTTGAIQLKYQNETEIINTGFYIGTPVVSIDWDGWVTVLTDVVTTINAIEDVYATTLERDNNDTYFMNYFYLSYQIPDQDESLGIYQRMTYEKSTGILEIMEIKVVIDLETPLDDIVQLFKVIRTEEAVTQDDLTDTNSDQDNITPGFELITLLGSIVLFSKFKKKYS